MNVSPHQDQEVVAQQTTTHCRVNFFLIVLKSKHLYSYQVMNKDTKHYEQSNEMIKSLKNYKQIASDLQCKSNEIVAYNSENRSNIFGYMYQ